MPQPRTPKKPIVLPSETPIADTVPEAPVTKPADRGSSRRIRRFVILSVVGFVVAVIAIFGVGAYAFHWDDQVTNMVLKVIPYPAARVESHIITYYSFRADIKTLNHYYANQDVTAGSTAPTSAQIEELVLNRLIRDYETEQLASSRGVTVSAADVDSRFGELVTEAGSLETITTTLTDLYNWDVATFKKKVIRPFLFRERLQQSLAEDADLQRDPLQQAEDILQQLKDGGSFEDLAKQYSDDSGTASNGGDLGYFGRGVMVAAFEDAAFALDPGEISDIVQSPFGFHIIKLEDKRETDVDGTLVPEIRARHILIGTTDVDTWVTEQMAQMTISSFIKNNRWDKTQGRIVNSTVATTTP